jgi:8-oxo-dGTP diphosphatase
MESIIDIHKAAGIIIRDKRLLVERSKNKEYFIAPGGSIEDGETASQALIRELKEEFNIDVLEKDLEFFGTFYAPAAGQEHRRLRSDVYIVKTWRGEPTPTSEVEELRWLQSDNAESLKIGSIFEHDVVPRLKEQDLIR